MHFNTVLYFLRNFLLYEFIIFSLCLYQIHYPLLKSLDSSNNLNIGLSPNDSKVVKEGITSIEFTKGYSSYIENYNSTSSSFYFSAVDGNLTINDIKFISSSSSCNPIVVYRSNFISFPFHVSTSPSEIKVYYNCSEQCNSTFTSEVYFENNEFITFEWHKNISNKCIGLNVGLKLFESNIIEEGYVKKEWDPNSHTKIIHKDILTTFIFISISHSYQSFRIEKAEIESSNKDICSPFIILPYDTIQNEPIMIAIDYNCSKPGQISALFTLKLEGYSPYKFGWVKNSGTNRMNLMMSTEKGFSDVVSHGSTMPLWLNGDYKIMSNVTRLYGYMILNNTQEILSPEIEIDDPTILDYELTGDLSKGGILDYEYKELNISYHCKRPGRAKMSLTIKLTGIFNPIVLKWTKICGVPHTDLMIGRHSSDDVVYKGVVTYLYNPIIFTAFERNSILEVNFTAKSESSDIFIKSLSIHARNDSCHPSISLIGDGNKITTEGRDINVIFDCDHEGSSIIDVYIELEGPYNGIHFTFKKLIGYHRYGLNIGSNIQADYGINDVVDNGIATLRWHPNSHTAIFLSYIDDTTFYITLDDPYTPLKIISIEPHSKKQFCDPLIEDNIPDDRYIKYNMTLYFKLYFNCKAPIRDTITVHIEIENFKPILISMTKIVGGKRRFFNIGTVPNSVDVVWDGVPMPLWHPEDPLNGALVAESKMTRFYISMSSTTQKQPYSAPYLIYSESDENILSPKIEGPSKDGGIAYYNGSMENYFDVIYNCRSLGYANVTIYINIYPFDLITYRWKKICSEYRKGLNIGTYEGYDDVVSDGQATMAWNIRSHVAFVLESVRNTTFYISLSEGQQRIKSINVTSDGWGCYPKIVSNIEPDTIIDSNGAEFDVVYGCTRVGKFNLTVWIELDGTYNPIGFTWTKRVGGIRLGLEAYAEELNSEVVQNGVVRVPWDPKVHSTNISKDDRLTTFNFMINPNDTNELNQVIENIEFNTSSSWLIIIPGGDLIHGGEIDNIAPKSLITKYICLTGIHNSYEEGINVTTTITLRAYDTISFAWKKFCHSNRKYLTVGTRKYSNDVVYDGITRAEWNLYGPEILVDTNTFMITFYVSLSSSHDYKEQPISEILVLQSTVENIYICTYSLSGPLVNTMVITREPQELHVIFNCSDRGEANFTLVLDLDNNYSSPAFGWVKKVGGPRRGLTIDSTYSKCPSVVRDGITEMKWDSDRYTNRITLDENTICSDFSLYMINNTQFPFQYHSNLSIEMYPENSCFLHFIGDGIKEGMINMTKKNISIVYECFEEEEIFFKVSFKINPFDEISFGWYKESNGRNLAFNLITSNNTIIAERGNTVDNIISMNETKIMKLYAYLSDDFIDHSLTTEYHNLTYSTSNELCKLNITGKEGGELNKYENRTIIIDASQCKLLVDTFINVTVDLYPFKPLLFRLRVPATTPENKFPVAIVVSIAGTVIIFGAIIVIVVHIKIKKSKELKKRRKNLLKVNEDVCLFYLFIYLIINILTFIFKIGGSTCNASK